MKFIFGPYRLDTDTGELAGPDGHIRLRRLTLRLLSELLEQAPAIVDRDRLLERVWGRTALSANVLPQAINQLRQVLGDDARDPKFIETCHRRGYRIICPVETLPGQDKHPAARKTGAPRTLLAATLSAMVVGGLFTFFLIDRFWSPSQQGAAFVAEQENALAESLRRQAEVAIARHDAAQAAAHLRALSLLRPDDLDLRLKLAEAELDALQGSSARRTLALLSTEPDLRQDERWLLLNARLAAINGDLAKAESLAQSATEKAYAHDRTDLAAAAVLKLSSLIKRGGDLRRAEQVLVNGLNHELLQFDQSHRARLILARLAMVRESGDLEAATILAAELEALEVEELVKLQAEVEIALIDCLRGNADRAGLRMDELQARAEELRNPDLLIALYNARGLAGIESGQVDQAASAFEKAFAIARNNSRAHQTAGLQVNAGMLMAHRGRMDEAVNLWQDTLETFESIDDRRGMAITLGNLAAAASTRGLNERSIELNERALVLLRELDLPEPRARTAFNLALIASRQGRLDDAEQLLGEAWGLYEEIGQTDRLLHVGSFRAEQRILAGDLIQAESMLLTLQDLAGMGSPLRQSALQAAAGRLHLWRGELTTARHAFEQALALRVQSGHSSWIASSRLDLLLIDLLEGADPWRVRIEAEAIADQFAESDQVRATARARLVAVEALLSQGAIDEARVLLNRIHAAQERFNDAALVLDIGWVEAWAARSEERVPRLEHLARQAMEMGFYGKLTRIAAGAAAQGIELDAELMARASTPPWIEEDRQRLVAVLPPYIQSTR